MQKKKTVSSDSPESIALLTNFVTTYAEKANTASDRTKSDKDLLDAFDKVLICAKRRSVTQIIKDPIRLQQLLSTRNDYASFDTRRALGYHISSKTQSRSQLVDLLATTYNQSNDPQNAKTPWWSNTVSIETLADSVQFFKQLNLKYPTALNDPNSLFNQIKRFERDYLLSFRRSPMPVDFLLRDKGESTEARGSGSSSRSAMLPAQHPLFKTLVAVALTAPELCRDILKTSTEQNINEKLFEVRGLAPTYLTISDFRYPMGGGESFVFETCRLLSEFGYRCVWASYSVAGHGNADTEIACSPFFDQINAALSTRTPNGIQTLIEDLEPDLLHTHGDLNRMVAPIANKLRIPTLLGHHFWPGLVRLADDREPSNSQILSRIDKHKPEPPPAKNMAPFIKSYVASEFMKEVYERSGGKRELDVLHPIPEKSTFLLEGKRDPKYVLQVNISKYKGGPIALECLKALGESVPFRLVRTEPNSDKLDEEIKAEIQKHPKSHLVGHAPIQEHLAQAKMVLVPSLVDETFGRIAFEAAANGIPVLSTRTGYVPYMLEDTGIYLSEDPKAWVAKIDQLANDQDALDRIGQAQKAHILEKYGLFPERFLQETLSMLADSPKRNIGVFVPWSEQGLGEVGRTVCRSFQRVGLRPHVFSFQAYAASNRGYARQSNPEDWHEGRDAVSVHYSLNSREKVTVHELEQFMCIKNARKLLYPEICFPINWQKISTLPGAGIDVIGMPMIETVRSSEVLNHNSLKATWSNTLQCEDVLRKEGITNSKFVGHGFGYSVPIEQNLMRLKRRKRRSRLSFCHIGGHNPLSRKQTNKVIEAFTKAAKIRKDIELCVFVMGGFTEGVEPNQHPRIKYRFENLKHDEILRAYENADASIQVSSHEGLGLGFYESLAMGTPIISLDLAPHNEVVRPNQSGWLIPVEKYILPDNNEALVTGGLFEEKHMVDLLCKLTKKETLELSTRVRDLHAEKFSEEAYAARIAAAVWNTPF